MSPARRNVRRREWPRGLYEPRPGYYVWRHPGSGETLTIGAVPFAHARNQALQANAHVMSLKPTLMDKLTGSTNTLADLLGAIKARLPRQPDGHFELSFELIYGHAIKPAPRLKVQAVSSVSVDEMRRMLKAAGLPAPP